MYKKLVVTILAIMMVIALTSCESKRPKEQPDSSGSEVETQEATNASDGIEQKVYQPEDDKLFVRFTNNAGKEIDLDVCVNYICDEYEGSAFREQKYLPNGEDYIIVVEGEGTIKDYLIDYDIKEASPSVKKYFEQTPYTTEVNSLGGIDYIMQDNTEEGFNDELYIFYEDTEGNILGYDETGYGGSGEMEFTFEAPGYEYDKYEIIREKM